MGIGRRAEAEPALSASAWRWQALVEVEDLRAQLGWMMSEQSNEPGAKALADAVEWQLKQAESVIRSRAAKRSLLTGSHIQATREYLDAATVNLLRLAPPPHLRSLLPNLLADARNHLRGTDPRLEVLAQIHDDNSGVLDEGRRLQVIAAVQGSHQEAHREQTRVRSFRNVILGVTAVIAAVSFVVAIVGWQGPGVFPLCFLPEEDGMATVACPLGDSPPFATPPQDVELTSELIAQTVTRLDLAVVEFLGALGATIAAASSLRTIRASADPYSLGVALALLKLPTGAITAFLGLLLIRSGFVPGLTALDTSAQIIAWAIILGYSQQIFTRLVDQQAQNVLQEAESVLPRGGRGP
jgi:hypothetical protein